MRLVFYFLTLVMLPLLVQAESSRGRLADGRAFRTDAQGNQLVDYIAELELSVEALNRRVAGLEDEVAEKDRAIDRLHRGESLNHDLSVRDLLTNDNTDKIKRAATTSSVNCQDTLEELNRSLASARAELKKNAQEHLKEVSLLQLEMGNLETELQAKNKDRQQQQNYRRKLDAAQADLVLEKEMQTQKHKALANSLAEALAQRDQDQKKLEELQAALQTKEQRVAELTRIVERQRNESSASLQHVRSATDDRAALAPSRARSLAVQSVRSSMLTQLNQLSSNITARDKLFKRYNAGTPNLKLKLTPAVSKRGYTINTIRSRLEHAGSVSAVSDLRQDMLEIRVKVSDDLSTIRRMLR
ncbi:MAG: hypothetical protein KDD42_03335 [Bdellovibrionales bacterium]|nr:hypothetical protein [Bdellovibrionales bacterium]